MKSMVFIIVIVYVLYFIAIINAELLEPSPKDDSIKKWEYDDDFALAKIGMEEEVSHPVNIATLNYRDKEKPIIGSFEDGKSNRELGAELHRNSSGYWMIVVTKKQDYETPIMQTYRFSVHLLEIKYDIALNILDIDDNAPVIHAERIKCSIKENYEGKSDCVYKITDADGWLNETEITIVETPLNDVHHFSMVTEAVHNNERIGYLYITKSLDYETTAMYMLQIIAKDRASNIGNTSSVIEVVDMPDEPPIWISLIVAETITEKSVSTFNVSAIDGDIGINAEINYKIDKTDDQPDDAKYFHVNTKTGVITTDKIDRDELRQEIFKFCIVAYEAQDNSSSIQSTIIIIVEDENDHVPEVQLDKISTEIMEGIYTTLNFGSPILVVDTDLAQNAQFDVTLKDTSTNEYSSAFMIIPNSGYQNSSFTVSVINATLLDYEDENWRHINIQIVATEQANNSHIGVKHIEINLKDWNDELPIFDNDSVTVRVKEDVKKDHKIAIMLATDRDVDDKVSYSLIVAQQNLVIDEMTGEVKTSLDKSFDYESMPVVVVQIVAKDLAEHKVYATLTVKVIDVNDEPPILILPTVTPTLEEELPLKTVLSTTILATDPDTDAKLTFAIDWENTFAYKSSIVVEPTIYVECLTIDLAYPKNYTGYAEGTLVVNKKIDYEEFDLLYLTIIVTDETTVHNSNSSSAILTIRIVDINDNPPIFGRIDEMKVLENQNSKMLIGKVTAYDIDGPGNNDIKYQIKPIKGTKNGLVTIDEIGGIIQVGIDKAIDAEEYEYLYYNVISTDGTFHTSEEVKIFVIDQNDEIPRVLKDQYEAVLHIKEKSPNGTEIVKIYATDDDRTSPYNNVSYLINKDYPELKQFFSVGKYDGQLCVNLAGDNTLDRDFGSPSYVVHLNLRDNYLVDTITWDSNVITSNVTIILDDINDQTPQLPVLDNPAANVSENTKKDQLILTVRAIDHDDPKTVNSKMVYKILSITSDRHEKAMLLNEGEKLFKVETKDFSIANIFTNKNLKGYYGIWSVQLYVQDLGTDPGPLSNTRIYNIRIFDYNYNQPIIEYPTENKNIRLSRNQRLYTQLIASNGQSLKDFKTFDEDFGDSGRVTLSISDETEAVNYFTIVPMDENITQLQLIKMPNFENISTFKLKLIAIDHGSPALNTWRTVKVTFVSTLGPEFEVNKWLVHFKENQTGLKEWEILPPAINDIDDDSDTINGLYYFLQNHEGDMSYFHLDKETRNLTLVKELDREQQENLTLYVITSLNSDEPPTNPPEKAILKVIVLVVDVNDNAPIFEKKFYSGGIAVEDPITKTVLSVEAIDADINDSLTYEIDYNSLEVSDESLTKISEPFIIDQNSGSVSLNFKPWNILKGHFSFDVIVFDEERHNDSTHLNIYIISASNRVMFTFQNNNTDLMNKKQFLIDVLSNTFGYICNIDYIEESSQTMSTRATQYVINLTVHFINKETNLPISADTIMLACNDLNTIYNLKAKLLSENLFLIDVPTNVQQIINENMKNTIQWIFITLTVVFFMSNIALVIVYFIRVKRLSEKLDKMALIDSDSKDTDVNHIGAVPTTNKFAMQGSNPVWENKLNIVQDNISQVSGDSDLIGIEHNPNFYYTQNDENVLEKNNNSTHFL